MSNPKKISIATINMLKKLAADETAPTTQASASDPKKELLAELIVDMQKEWQAMVQYINHAEMVMGPEWAAHAAELKTHADEEYAHAKALATRIQFLGGSPATIMAAVKTASSPKEMIQLDLDGEKEAIERYRKRIIQAEALNDFGTSELIRGILADEEEHQNDLETILGIKRRG